MNEKDFESLLKSVNEAGQILRGELKPTRAIQIKVSKLPSAKREGFALCLKSDEPDLLVPMKVYRVKFSSNGYIGVIDEEGEAAFYRTNDLSDGQRKCSRLPLFWADSQ